MLDHFYKQPKMFCLWVKIILTLNSGCPSSSLHALEFLWMHQSGNKLKNYENRAVFFYTPTVIVESSDFSLEKMQETKTLRAFSLPAVLWLCNHPKVVH